MKLRVVFDTDVVISALLFRSGRRSWLRAHWASGTVIPLASSATVTELVGALAYPKSGLTRDEIENRLGDYLPHVEVVAKRTGAVSSLRCRDAADQAFVDLALAGRADVLVTGDKDLLALAAQAPFALETPEAYGKRFGGPELERQLETAERVMREDRDVLRKLSKS